MGLNTGHHVGMALVFMEGLLSFFSPCVIPLIPIYLSYLAGGITYDDNSGEVIYDRRRMLINTLFFVLGISFAFFILGMSFSFLGKLLIRYRSIIATVGGIFVLIMGLNQLGVIKLTFLSFEKRINSGAARRTMNPVNAFIMGFVFSFAWTPCVGPALSSVLIMASSAQTQLIGNLYVLVYAIGFLIPFLVLGLFTTQALSFIKTKKGVMKGAVNLGGVILVLIGALLIFGAFGKFESLFNFGSDKVEMSSDNKSGNEDTKSEGTKDKKDSKGEKDKDSKTSGDEKSGSEDEKSEQGKNSDTKEIAAPEISLRDQNGNLHSLSNYKGQVVLVNFWATWCTHCKDELPALQKVYDKYKDSDRVKVLTVVTPGIGREGDEQHIKDFIKENNITFPVLFDKDGSVTMSYNAISLPTSYMIKKDGNIYAFTRGALEYMQFLRFIDDADNEKSLQ